MTKRKSCESWDGKEGCDLKEVARPPLVLDDSQNAPCFEPLLFLIGIMLLILFLLVGIK